MARYFNIKVGLRLNVWSSINEFETMCKRFTNVVKTIANSTTYCRKQGDCNGIIIFEVDIMKNSSPLNLKFTIFAMSKPK